MVLYATNLQGSHIMIPAQERAQAKERQINTNKEGMIKVIRSIAFCHKYDRYTKFVLEMESQI